MPLTLSKWQDCTSVNVEWDKNTVGKRDMNNGKRRTTICFRKMTAAMMYAV
jgi:hypothetical protein